MTKFNQSLKLIKILLSIFFVLLLICNVCTPLLADDFSYLYSFADGDARISNIIDIFPSMAAHAYSMNGRLVAHFFVQAMGILPSFLFDVINTFMFLLQLILIYLFCKNPDKHNSLLLAAIFSLIWIYEPAFGQVNLWMDGSCNYLWSMVFGLLYLWPFINEFQYDRFITNPYLKIIYIGICFIFGAYLENTSAAMIFMSTVFILLFRFYQKKPIKVFYLITLATSAIGYLSIYLAPAQWQNKAAGFNLATIKDNFITALTVYKIFFVPLSIYFILLIIAYSIKINRSRIILSLVFFAGSLCSNFMMVVASYYPERCAFCPAILLITAIGVLFESIFETQYKTVLICALSILFLWTSFDIIISVNDIYVTNEQINANENYILESKKNNILDVSVPMVSTDMKHNALYNSKYLDTETTESWPNKGMSLYYGVNSIIGYY